MTTYSPEFSAYWLDTSSGSGEPVIAATSPVAPISPSSSSSSPRSQQTVFDELVERVNAARSVV